MATIKGSDYAGDIKDAIKRLSMRVEEFDSEAKMCDSERLGEVKKDGVRTRIAIEPIQELLQQTKQEKELLYERIRFLESRAVGDEERTKNSVLGLRQNMMQEDLQIAVYNAFYGLFMAHPNVDDRTGKPAAKPEGFGFTALQPPPQQDKSQLNSIQLWLQELGQTSSDSSYIDKCLESVWDLSLKDMDRVKYVMASPELRSWLRSSKPTMLVIDSETRPAEVFNALTSSIAIITHTLISEAKFPVLSFFCGLHADEVYDEQSSGPMGMLNCLNAQLVSYFQERNLHMTLNEQLNKLKFRRKSQTSTSKSLGLLESLFKDLPENSPVVVIIDSACRLLGSRTLANQAIGGLLEVARRADRAVKILITSPWSTEELGLNNFMQVYIPDYIDGDREGLNLELVQKDAAEAATVSMAKVKSFDDSDSTITSASGSDYEW